jgi:prolipoprotein diacylglyceryltransferase
MLVGMVFTRFGCLLAGCCGGRESHHWTALGRRHPVPLFEASLAAVLLAAAILLVRSAPAPGTVLLSALGGYAAGRVLLEPLRAPDPASSRLLAARFVSAALVVTVALAALLQGGIAP